MTEDPPGRFRPSAGAVATAVACGVLALAGLFSLPALEQAEPGTIGDLAPTGSAGWWALAVVLMAQAAALMALRRYPRSLLVGISAAPILVAVLAPGPGFGLTTLCVLVGVFLVVAAHPLPRLRWALATVLVLIATGQVANDVLGGPASAPAVVAAATVQAVAVVGAPLLVALMVAARRETRAARAGEVRALRREHDALVQAAVARERTSMSRELHDIAAHHMSGIALMAAAIDRQVDTDPAAARLAARQVRTQSTAVLDDLRRIVGLLREDADGTRGVQTLASVRDLVEDRRAAGLVVDFAVLAAPGAAATGAGVGPLAQLVVYRMVQESLANAASHAPGARCRVELDDRDPARFSARVSNDPFHGSDPGPGSGFGLLGLRERAELVGATLRHGTPDRGGWEVVLVLPRTDTLAAGPAAGHDTDPEDA